MKLRSKRILAILFALTLLSTIVVSAGAQVNTGIDDPVPDTACFTCFDSYIYKIFLPDGESYSTNPNNLLLNLFSSQSPSYGTNLTKAPDTNNGTQWFRRMTVTLNGSVYYVQATYNDVCYSINCRRLNTTGSYVNVVPSIGNNRGDLNIHSPRCFDEGQSSHFLAAPPRDMQTSIMVICATGESTGYTNNTYLKWQSTSTYLQNSQHAFLYRKGIGYITGYCVD